MKYDFIFILGFQLQDHSLYIFKYSISMKNNFKPRILCPQGFWLSDAQPVYTFPLNVTYLCLLPIFKSSGDRILCNLN